MHSLLQLPFKPGYNYQHYFQKLKSIHVSVSCFSKNYKQSGTKDSHISIHRWAFKFLQIFKFTVLNPDPRVWVFRF